jgi:CubicO group peptidase (beta-lactamase class C family)
MLLNHRSGLPDYTHWAVPYANRSKRIFYNDDIIKLLASVKPHLDFPSNTHFKYSNTNYAVLAKLIEIVTEMPYKSFMQKYIFKPLGMEHTFVFDPADGLPASASISYKYNWQAEPVMFADGIYGDKGIYSTVRDMYKWDQSFYQNKLLNNEVPIIDGDGQQTRDFTFVENVVQINIKAMLSENKDAFGQIFNVATGYNYSVLHMFNSMQKTIGTQFASSHRETRNGDIRNSLADISKATNLLNYNPQVQFEEGLARTITYFRELNSK